MSKSGESERTIDVDHLIKGGHVIDAGNDIDRVLDVAVKNGKIYAVGEKLNLKARSMFDATNLIVTPGLVDCHIHGYHYATPLGIDVDQHCLARGTTTAVDAGSSGASTFQGFRKFIVEQKKTRLFAFLHIANHGLASAGCSGNATGGECDSLNQVDEDACVKCIEENRDLLVGVKVRLSASCTNDGVNEKEVFRRALKAAERAKVPLMTHHTVSTIPLQQPTWNGPGCPGSMKQGDIYTHTMHAWQSSIIDDVSKNVHSAVKSARENGVLFDLGHGQGSFNWTVGEICAKNDFWPDIISTDLHSQNINGPAYDLPFVMSKLFHLGMPLEKVIAAVTYTPAKAIGKEKIIGTLSVGAPADITVLEIIEDMQPMLISDSQAQLRNVKRLIQPVAVWRGGTQFRIQPNSYKMDMKKFYELAKDWPRMVVKDEKPPCPPSFMTANNI